MTIDEIQPIIEDVLTKLGVSYTLIEIRDADSQPRFHIETEESGALIGTRGETLRALNYLVRRIVEAQAEAAPDFLVDINGYQERQIEKIRGQARMLAERAKLFRYDVEMSPMNAYERLIVHSTFADDPEIETQSQGEGKFRRVVIKYVDPHHSTQSESSEGDTSLNI